MTENINVKQSERSFNRRWFSDDYFDLITWQDGEKNIVRFELCYGKYKDEQALVWNKEKGYQHLKVDDGEDVYARKAYGVRLVY